VIKVSQRRRNTSMDAQNRQEPAGETTYSKGISILTGGSSAISLGKREKRGDISRDIDKVVGRRAGDNGEVFSMITYQASTRPTYF